MSELNDPRRWRAGSRLGHRSRHDQRERHFGSALVDDSARVVAAQAPTGLGRVEEERRLDGALDLTPDFIVDVIAHFGDRNRWRLGVEARDHGIAHVEHVAGDESSRAGGEVPSENQVGPGDPHRLERSEDAPFVVLAQASGHFAIAVAQTPERRWRGDGFAIDAAQSTQRDDVARRLPERCQRMERQHLGPLVGIEWVELGEVRDAGARGRLDDQDRRCIARRCRRVVQGEGAGIEGLGHVDDDRTDHREAIGGMGMGEVDAVPVVAGAAHRIRKLQPRPVGVSMRKTSEGKGNKQSHASAIGLHPSVTTYRVNPASGDGAGPASGVDAVPPSQPNDIAEASQTIGNQPARKRDGARCIVQPCRRTAARRKSRSSPSHPVQRVVRTADHVMFMMIVFLWVKCSSIDSSEASLPRPERLTPP